MDKYKNNRFYTLLFTVCLLSCFENVFSQKWICFTENNTKIPVEKEIVIDNEDSYKIHIILNGIYDNCQTNKYGTFHSLTFGEYGFLAEEGHPELPTMSQLIAVPPGTKPSISIEENTWTGISIGRIFPVQKQYYDESATKEFFIDYAAYKRDFLPELYHHSQEMSWRGIKNMSVQICPFKYYPQNDSLYILTDFYLKVDFRKNTSTRNVLYRETNHFGLFDNSVYVEKKGSLHDSKSDNYDYLIVLGNNNLYGEWLKEFRRWKAYKGLKTKVILSDSKSFIKDYITSAYRNNGLKYVLLVGDTRMIPPQSFLYYDDNGKHHYYESDYWYGCVDGENDVQQDVAIARFPVSELTPYNDFIKMVIKTIRYESWKNLDYKALLISHSYPEYTSCCDSIYNYTYSEPLPFVKLYGDNNTIRNVDINNGINQGAHIINYRGHASNNYWGSPNWNSSNETYLESEIHNIHSNTNAVFFSIACYTGSIHLDSCMLKTFLRAPGGAVSFLGSSRPSKTGENSLFNKLLYRNLLDSMSYNLGNVVMRSSINNIQISCNKERAIGNVFSYINGGDPSLELWTDLPQSFGDVRLLEENNNLIIVTQSNNYSVSVVSEDGDLIGLYSAGSANSCTFPRPLGNFYIGVNKHNYIPHVIYYNVDKGIIQNETINVDSYYHHTPIMIGDGVSMDIMSGPVIVKKGTKLIITNRSEGVKIDTGFECEKGAILEIK